MSATNSPSSFDKPVEVTWEDQQKINRFSLENSAFLSLQSALKALEQQYEGIDDAYNEMELLDDDERTKMSIGECYIEMTVEKARERLQTQRNELKAKVDANKTQLKAHQAQMAQLKSVLYAKFGSNINLENE